MAKLLHLVASPQPSNKSFSRMVADAFVSAYKESHPGDTVDTFDIWSEPLPEMGAITASWKVKAMTGQAPNAEEIAERDRLEAVVTRFKAADKYLFSVPMWNFNIPYKLKHFIDVVVQPGMTFSFDPAKGYSGLIPSTRPVYVVQSRGGTYAAAPMAAMDFQQPYLNAVFGFIGLTNVTTQLVECTAYGPQVSDPIVSAAVSSAMIVAKSF